MAALIMLSIPKIASQIFTSQHVPGAKFRPTARTAGCMTTASSVPIVVWCLIRSGQDRQGWVIAPTSGSNTGMYEVECSGSETLSRGAAKLHILFAGPWHV